MPALDNPERAWARPAHLANLPVSEVERRIGPVPGRIEVLSGGLANLNLHIEGRGVLRVYRSELGTPRKEAQLLALPWQRLRVPRVLEEGADFLLLEHVPHTPLQDAQQYGRVVGSALAEIHARPFLQAGLLGTDLTVTHPFGADLQMLEHHAREQLRRAGRAELEDALLHCLSRARAALSELAQPYVLLHSDFKVSNLHWTRDEQLLVLDWETAYAGPPLLDIGQLLRWAPPEPFVRAFARAYQEHGGQLPSNWQLNAAAFDAINLASLLGGSEPGSRRAREVEARLRRTLAAAAP